MPFQRCGDFKLGADPVNTGDQNRLLMSLKLKKPAKEPRASQDLRAEGRAGKLFNQFFNLIGSVNINASRGIGLFNLPCLLS